MDSPDDPSDDEVLPPRPWTIPAAAVVTSLLGMLEARQAEGMLGFMREPSPPTPGNFPMAVHHALWTAVQAHRRGLVAVEAARMLLAGLLFVGAVRVLVRSTNAGWLWRQALVGNVAVTFAAAWFERHMVPTWSAAFQRALAMAPNPIPSPQKQVPVEEFFRLTASVSVWGTAVLGGIFLAALGFASRPRTREHTG
mgnify:CR=1 FL=1